MSDLIFSRLADGAENQASGAPETRPSSDFTDAILVDVSAFCGNPFLTGIQRQLEALLSFKGPRQLIPFVVEDPLTLRILPQRFFDLVETFFRSGEDELTEARVHFHGSHKGRNSFYVLVRHYTARFGKICDPEILFRIARAVLSTEYILNENYLNFYDNYMSKYGFKFFFMEHDLVFWTLRRHFAEMEEHIGHVKHLQLMRRATNLACVSDTVLHDLRSVARRDTVRHTEIILPGGDSLGQAAFQPAPATLKVAIVGTIEPRKCSGTVLDVLEQMARRVPLEAVFCGMISTICDADLKQRFEDLQEPFLPIRLLASPSDSDIREIVLGSSVTIYVSDGEGFGVPPLESLALRVPVIVSASVPSLAYVPPDGQIRLASNSPEALYEALLRFNDRGFAEAKRRETVKVTVPTWRGFADSIFSWIDRVTRSNVATDLMHRSPVAARDLAQKFDGFWHGAVREPTHASDGSRDGRDFSHFGLSANYDNDDPPLEHGSFGYESRLFTRTMGELYRAYRIFENGRQGNFRRNYSLALLHREGSPEDQRHWHRDWPRRSDAFAAFLAFLCSEESHEKDPARPTVVCDIFRKIAPTVNLLLDDKVQGDEFITEAHLAILSSLPAPRSIEAHLPGLESGGEEARRDLLRSLLVSDPGLEMWYPDAEAWSLLLAFLGISTPYWEFARGAYQAAQASVGAVVSADAWPRWEAGGRRSRLAPLSAQFFSGKAVDWLPMMHVGSAGQWIDGVVRSKGSATGHMAFGPYLKLGAGGYRLTIVIAAGESEAGADTTHPVATVEAVAANPERYLVQQDLRIEDCAKGRHVLEFTLGEDIETAGPPAIEVRVWTSGAVALVLSAVLLERTKVGKR